MENLRVIGNGRLKLITAPFIIDNEYEHITFCTGIHAYYCNYAIVAFYKVAKFVATLAFIVTVNKRLSNLYQFVL